MKLHNFKLTLSEILGASAILSEIIDPRVFRLDLLILGSNQRLTKIHSAIESLHPTIGLSQQGMHLTVVLLIQYEMLVGISIVFHAVSHQQRCLP